MLKEIGLGKSLKHFNVLDIVFVRSTGLHSEIDYSESGGLLEPNLQEKRLPFFTTAPALILVVNNTSVILDKFLRSMDSVHIFQWTQYTYFN